MSSKYANIIDKLNKLYEKLDEEFENEKSFKIDIWKEIIKTKKLINSILQLLHGEQIREGKQIKQKYIKLFEKINIKEQKMYKQKYIKYMNKYYKLKRCNFNNSP